MNRPATAPRHQGPACRTDRQPLSEPVRKRLALWVRLQGGEGDLEISDSLGPCRLPPGYALMQTAERTHYYWLRHDGTVSDITWNRWIAYHGAWADHERREARRRHWRRAAEKPSFSVAR